MADKLENDTNNSPQENISKSSIRVVTAKFIILIGLLCFIFCIAAVIIIMNYYSRDIINKVELRIAQAKDDSRLEDNINNRINLVSENINGKFDNISEILSGLNFSSVEKNIESHLKDSLDQTIKSFNETYLQNMNELYLKNLNDVFLNINDKLSTIDPSVIENNISTYLKDNFSESFSYFVEKNLQEVNDLHLKNFNDQFQTIREYLEAVEPSQLSQHISNAIQTHLDPYTTISKERKASELLDLARQTREDFPSEASFYYWAAVEASPNKLEPLKEYITWQSGEIDAALENNEVVLAREKMGMALDILDAQLYKGSVFDIQSFAALREELQIIDNSITKHADAAVAAQRAEIQRIIESYQLGEPFNSYNWDLYEKALNELEKINPLPEVELLFEDTNEIVNSYTRNYAAFTSLSQNDKPAVVPLDNTKEIAENWITQVIDRFENPELQLEIKIADFEMVGQYLSTLDFTLEEDILSRLGKAENLLTAQLWDSQAEEILSNKPSITTPEYLGQLDQLYRQGVSLISSKITLQKLPEVAIRYFQEREKELKNNLEKLSSFEGKYTEDILQQLASQYRFQVASLAIELQTAENNIPTLSNNRNLNNNLLNLMETSSNSYKKYGVKVEEIVVDYEKEAEKKFQDYIAPFIACAQNKYVEAENKA
ncbi:MAG: hypothetical protein LBD41_00370, partial [Clostridiales Family XIII bacterium]|nr:hypothetical protein [Clostridiales Family XIII bacterium]